MDVNLLSTAAPACGVTTGQGVTLTCTSGGTDSTTTTTTSVLQTQLVVTPLPSQVADGWTPWLYTGIGPLRTFGSSRTPVTEVYSRNLSIGGLQYLEMTFSW